MDDISLSEFFLTALLSYGSPIVMVALFLNALGAPIGGSLLVLAGGAFVQQGVLDWPTVLLFGFTGTVLGDSSSYSIGRLAKRWVHRKFGHTDTWQTAQIKFDRRGGTATYLTRFLLTPLAVPTNLIAGSSGYAFWRFLFYDVAGEITWFTLYGGLGFIFGSNWEVINQFLNDVSGLLAGLVLLALGVYFLRRYRRSRTLRSQPA